MGRQIFTLYPSKPMDIILLFSISPPPVSVCLSPSVCLSVNFSVCLSVNSSISANSAVYLLYFIADDVDLDALLDDLNKFNPLEQQNTEPGPPPPQPKPVESALPPQPQLQPEPKPKNTHVYHEIQGPTRTIVDKPPELKPRNSSNDLVNGKNSVAPSVSNGGVHQGSALNSPSFHAIPEAKEVHLTGKPTVVHNAKENQVG
jgi:hypothetical protein